MSIPSFLRAVAAVTVAVTGRWDSLSIILPRASWRVKTIVTWSSCESKWVDN
jgi:hypothetical protein